MLPTLPLPPQPGRLVAFTRFPATLNGCHSRPPPGVSTQYDPGFPCTFPICFYRVMPVNYLDPGRLLEDGQCWEFSCPLFCLVNDLLLMLDYRRMVFLDIHNRFRLQCVSCIQIPGGRAMCPSPTSGKVLIGREWMDSALAVHYDAT